MDSSLEQRGTSSSSRADRGKRNFKKGYCFEDRVAEAYRLLGYTVQHGRLFSGRQVDMFMELRHGDILIRRAIECKAGEVTTSDIDDFSIKLRLVRREYPDASGAIVAGLSFTDAVTTQGAAEGIQLTLYRDLSAQIVEAHAYARNLLMDIDSNDRYKTNLFVEPSIGYTSAGDSLKAFTVLDEWLQDSSWNQFTLLGDVGSGKSFFCRMVARRLLSAFLERPNERPFPVLIDLRNADREFSLEGLALTHFARHGLDRVPFSVFEYLVAEGRIILLLDGFDEMASKVTPAITTRNFHELTRAVKRNAKVLLTCRTHYFKSRTEEEEVVLSSSSDPYSSEVARDLYWDLISRSGFRIAYLKSFSLTEIDAYIDCACGVRARELKEKIVRIYNLAELSQGPFFST